METLSETQVGKWIARSIPAADFRGKRVLLIVPDATRTAPLPLLFHTLHELLAPVTARIDVLVALGTHPPMSEDQIGLGFRDPADVDVESFADRQDEGILLVRKAGEHLYRLNENA